MIEDFSTVDTYRGLFPIDYAAIALYFSLMLWLGYFFGRHQRDTEEYFVAGRNMPAWAVGISIFATLLSTISYLAVPGEMIKHGAGILAGHLSMPLTFLVVGYLIIPYFMRLRLTTAYEYLEQRFDLSTRIFAALLFGSIRLSWMGIIVFTASVAMTKIIGMRPEQTWIVALAVGTIAIAYTTMGGIRAVIWTDVGQFLILFGGAVFTVCYVAFYTGTGPLIWWQDATAMAANRVSQPLWSWDPFTRVTYGGMIISVFSWWLCTANSDQVAIQRYFSTPSTNAARRSFAINLMVGLLVSIFLTLCGIALYSYYQGNLPDRPDEVFPHFIRHQLPRGLAGLLVAALFSAAMSSLDSGMNSLATVVTIDFYRRLWRKRPDAQTELTLARMITAGVGILAVFICVLLTWIPAEKRGNITDVTNQLNTFVVGGLGGLFCIAMFLKRCTGPTAILATLLGMTVGFILALGHWIVDLGVDGLGNPRQFSWMWVIPTSTLTTLLAAPVMDWFVRRLNPRIQP